MSEHTGIRYTSYLTRPELWALDEALQSIKNIGPAYLVGSVLFRPDFRDVDVRVILTDETYDALVEESWIYMGFVISRHIAALTALPVDVQIQRQTEANKKFGNMPRNPIGRRKIGRDWIGDHQ